MSEIQATKRKRGRERIYLRVVKGGFKPADSYAYGRLREKGYGIGDVVGAEIRKIRNPKFNRLVHRIAQLCAANIDAFSGMDAHRVIKRLQLEGNIACEELGIVVPGVGMVTAKIPQSLSFDSMDEGEYREVARSLCRHIAENYWTSLTPEQIEEMAESFVGEA